MSWILQHTERPWGLRTPPSSVNQGAETLPPSQAGRGTAGRVRSGQAQALGSKDGPQLWGQLHLTSKKQSVSSSVKKLISSVVKLFVDVNTIHIIALRKQYFLVLLKIFDISC